MLFVLRHIEGLELGDVAAALKVSVATGIKRSLPKVSARVHAMAAGDPLLSTYLAPVTLAPPAPGDDGPSSNEARLASEAINVDA